MAGDRHTRRLTPETAPPRRTLDDAPPAVPASPTEVAPSEVLDAPPAQHAAARLDERQKRWLQLRENALKLSRKVQSSTAEPAENRGDDPKG